MSESTYFRNPFIEGWSGHEYECQLCYFHFMLEWDLKECYCPKCGTKLIWGGIKDYEQ
jgi:hypothetical protein